jgi:hypothetical protein
MQLAARAQAQQGRNAPRTLVLGAALLAVLAAGYAWSGFRARASARADLADAKSRAELMISTAGTLRAARDAQGAGGAIASEPDGQMLSKIEAAGPISGLARPVPVGRRRPVPDRTTKWTQVFVDYTGIKDPSMDAVMGWVDASLRAVPGLEVHGITIKPEKHEWLVNVTFVRWEKSGA